jgi:hypothetical protein
MTEPTIDKKARDMTPEGYKAKLAELRRGPPPPPVTLPERHARDLSESERREWLQAHRRKFQ